MKKNDLNMQTPIFFKSNKHSLSYENDLFFLDIINMAYMRNSKYHYQQHTLHSHSCYELQIVLKGESEYEFNNNKRVKLKKGHYLLFPPYFKHRIVSEFPEFSKLSSSFAFMPKSNNTTNFYQFAEELANDITVRKISKSMESLIDIILSYNKGKTHDYAHAVLFSFLSLAIEIFQMIVGDRESKDVRDYNDKRINDAISYIEKNIFSGITVKDVADHVHISSKQLTRIFSNVLKISPGNYIKNIKMKQMRNLISNVDLTLGEIAEIMGYSDEMSLIKAFKRVEDITPSQYRKRLFME